MADSVRKKIFDNVKTVLESITVANGYDFNMGEVSNVPKSFSEYAVLPIIQFLSISEDMNEDSPVTKTNCKSHLVLQYLAFEHHDLFEQLMSALAMIEKALKLDITRGGNAYYTELISNETILSSETMPYGGLNIGVDIHFRYVTGNPITL